MRFTVARRLTRGLLIGASLTGVVLMTAGTAAETVTSQETRRARCGVRSSVCRCYRRVRPPDVRRRTRRSDAQRYAYNGGLRYAAEMAAKRTSGVDEVANRLEVLPSSQEDDRIRWATFYRIYTDAFLSRYRIGRRHGCTARDLPRPGAGADCIDRLASTRSTSSCVMDRRPCTASSIATPTSRLPR